jgi:hypothetical protein
LDGYIKFALSFLKKYSMPSKDIIKKITVDKDAALAVIINQLQNALPDLKEQLGEKKFEKRIKKAAKLLIAGFKKTPVKKVVPDAKKVTTPAKKTTPAPKKAIAPAKKPVKKVAKK